MTELEKEERKMLLSATLQQEHVSCSAAQAVDGMMLPAGLLKAAAEWLYTLYVTPALLPGWLHRGVKHQVLGRMLPEPSVHSKRDGERSSSRFACKCHLWKVLKGLELPWSWGAMVVVDEDGKGKECRTMRVHLRSVHL